MRREPLGRALTRQTDGVNPTILDDPLDAQGGTSCRNCSWTSSPHWMARGREGLARWGLEGPEYLAWLGQQPERDYTILMGANTYRLMSGFATESKASASDEPMTDEGAAIAELARASTVVFSSTLQPPLSWPNTRLISGDAVEAVAAMKQDGTSPMRTLGSLTLCRSLLEAGLVDRFRVVVFPVITGSTGRDRIYDGYPDVTLEMVASRTFDGRLQLLEYVPTVLTGPPGSQHPAS